MKPATKNRLRKAMHDPLTCLVVITIALLVVALFDMQGIWMPLGDICLGVYYLIVMARGSDLGGERLSRSSRITFALCGAVFVILGVFNLLDT